jgi:hypothetical protein
VILDPDLQTRSAIAVDVPPWGPRGPGFDEGPYASGVVQQEGALPQESRVPQAGWESALGRSPEAACPLLGLREDPRSHFSMPVDEHRCLAGGKPAAIDMAHQRDVCLSGAFAACERLTARRDAAGIIASVHPPGSPGPGTAPSGVQASAPGMAAAFGPASDPSASGPPSSSGPASPSYDGGPRRPRRRLVLVVGAVLIMLAALVVLFAAAIILAPVAAGSS